jgi:hypothetical protein
MEWICLPTGPAASFGYMLERTILEFVSPPIVKRGQRLSVWNGSYADAGTLHQPMVLSSSASTPPGNHPGWPKLECLNTHPLALDISYQIISHSISHYALLYVQSMGFFSFYATDFSIYQMKCNDN